MIMLLVPLVQVAVQEEENSTNESNEVDGLEGKPTVQGY